VKEVGQDVGGVREEEQPGHQEDRERQAAGGAVQHDHRADQPGEEGQEEVPVEEEEGFGVGHDKPEDRQSEAEQAHHRQQESDVEAVRFPEFCEHLFHGVFNKRT
jgi:hypothetical protein